MTEVGAQWRLDLPDGAPTLTLNGRYHWAVRSRESKRLRGVAFWLATGDRLPKGLGFVEVTLHWQPPTRGRRDPDNMFAYLKPLLDGLRDYGLVADDDSKHVRPLCEVEPAARPARMWLTITDLSGPEEMP